MDRLDQLNTLYDHYRTELAKVKKAAGHGGFMGLGMDPRKHPCNQEFYEAVEAWVRQFLAQSPTHEAIFAATEYILHADLRLSFCGTGPLLPAHPLPDGGGAANPLDLV